MVRLINNLFLYIIFTNRGDRMNNNSTKVMFITGASSGMGKAVAYHYYKLGYRVYGTSRKPQDPEAVIKDESSGGFLKMIQLDVCSDESVKNAVDYILSKEGKIDIFINCAGFGLAGAVEETTADEAYSQFNTNTFGALRMYGQVVPAMRKNNGGRIIVVSSVAGYISVPFQSMYSASKYALEAITEALRIEIKPFNIKVSMIEPGDMATGFTDNRKYVAAAADGKSLYGQKFTKAVNAMIESERKGPAPETLIKLVDKMLNAKNPPIRVTVGASYKFVAVLKRILPSKTVEFILEKMY
jgi:short-subunit dehydrogenase